MRPSILRALPPNNNANMFELHNKVALVTGARRGMGKAHALALAKQGAKVAVTDVENDIMDI